MKLDKSLPVETRVADRDLGPVVDHRSGSSCPNNHVDGVVGVARIALNTAGDATGRPKFRRPSADRGQRSHSQCDRQKCSQRPNWEEIGLKMRSDAPLGGDFQTEFRLPPYFCWSRIVVPDDPISRIIPTIAGVRPRTKKSDSRDDRIERAGSGNDPTPARFQEPRDRAELEKRQFVSIQPSEEYGLRSQDGPRRADQRVFYHLPNSPTYSLR